MADVVSEIGRVREALRSGFPGKEKQSIRDLLARMFRR